MSRISTYTSIRNGMLAGAAMVALAVSPALSQTPTLVEFDIDAQELGGALTEFGIQSRTEVLFNGSELRGVQTAGVEGTFSADRAIGILLDDTGIDYRRNDDGTLLVGKASVQTASLQSKRPSLGEESAPDPSRVAQLDQEDSEPVERVREGRVQEGERVEDVIVVTGTNIRGIAPESSPVLTFGRDDILATGAATAQDFIQTLPQNFGGGSNDDLAGLPNDASSGFNSSQGGTLGSSVNLRGLGSGGTLVLLNGRRLAPSSGIGDFVDISLIPVSAIERVEVLTDGASSIYGGDAVAGVVNFVLRSDYDGVEASFRHGFATEGTLNDYRASLTGGKSWDTGNALFVYEYFERGALAAQDRSFSQGAAFPNDLLPRQERHSVLGSISQEVSSDLKIFADVTYSSREARQDFTNASGSQFRSIPSSQNLNISAGGTWAMFDDWFVDVSGAYSQIRSESTLTGSSPGAREVDSDLWAVDGKTSGPLFQLPGGEVKLAVGGHYRDETFSNLNLATNTLDREADRNVYAVYGEVFIPLIGPGNSMAGIERLEINASGRISDFSDFGTTSNPKVGILWSPIDTLRLRSSYSTSFNPPPLGRVGATDLVASAFRTSFANSVFGFTPGDPSIADVVAITAFGTSDELDAETSRSFTAGFDFDEEWGRNSIKVSSTYFDIDFEDRLGSTPIPDNRREFDAPNIAINSPELFPDGTILFFPSRSEVASFIDSLDRINPFPGVDPLDAEIINIVPVVRNLANTVVRGFDVDMAYTYDSDFGALSLGLDGTILKDFQQQAASTTPLIEQVDTLFNPTDLRLRGRAGYSNKGVSANVFVNYTDDYRVDNTQGSAFVDSWTTVDISLSYDTSEEFDSKLFNNTMFRLSILNVFNEDPPSTPSNPSFRIFGYDPANASPLGRFVSLELTKRF